MFFTFKLLDVKCNAVLSGEDSMWGKKDGIRVFFLVFTASGFRQLYISGREYPPPDIVDNYSFVPGEKLDLQFFPPLNAPDWETDPVDVGEGDTVSIAVVGVNEGLPYITGGGGFGTESKATMAGIEELSKKMVEEAAKGSAQVAGGVALTVAFKLLEEFIEELNKASDCRGVAFAFEVDLSMKRLLQDHLHKKRSTLTLNAVHAANALHIVALSKISADCGNPDYEVQLEIARHQLLDLAVDDRTSLPLQGPPRPFNSTFELCKPKEKEIFVWPIYHDRTITVQPTVPKYTGFKPTWKVDDVVLPDNGKVPLSRTKEVEIPVSSAKEIRNVQVDCEVVTIGAAHQLRLKTRGLDGNYTLKVSLSYQFEDNGPWVLFQEKELFVVGQGMDGNEAYYDYLSCLGRFHNVLTKYVRGRPYRVFPDIEPGTPVEEVIRFERDMLTMARMFAQVAREHDIEGSEKLRELGSE